MLARRNLLANLRLPDVLLLSTIQPVTFMLTFLCVFGGAIEATLPPAAHGEYVNWLIPGILAQSAVFGAGPTAYGLNNDRALGVIDRFRSLAMARSAVLAGRTLADLTRSTAILALQLGVGMLLGFRWQTSIVGMLAAVGLALAFGYACSWVMATIGLAARNTEAIQAAIYLVVFPLTLVSSVFLPTRSMPGWLQAFAEHQPITVAANAMRALTLGTGALPPDIPSPVKSCPRWPEPWRSSRCSHRSPCGSTAEASTERISSGPRDELRANRPAPSSEDVGEACNRSPVQVDVACSEIGPRRDRGSHGSRPVPGIGVRGHGCTSGTNGRPSVPRRGPARCR